MTGCQSTAGMKSKQDGSVIPRWADGDVPSVNQPCTKKRKRKPFIWRMAKHLPSGWGCLVRGRWPQSTSLLFGFSLGGRLYGAPPEVASRKKLTTTSWNWECSDQILLGQHSSNKMWMKPLGWRGSRNCFLFFEVHFGNMKEEPPLSKQGSSGDPSSFKVEHGHVITLCEVPQ